MNAKEVETCKSIVYASGAKYSAYARPLTPEMHAYIRAHHKEGVQWIIEECWATTGDVLAYRWFIYIVHKGHGGLTIHEALDEYCLRTRLMLLDGELITQDGTQVYQLLLGV